ncbi:hypothetical protein [Nocardia sp. NPDC049526]
MVELLGTITDRAITRIAVFGGANLVTACGFPAIMPEPAEPYR